jgi:RNA polymerase sigma-70 factor (ECF subfamily)
MRRWRLVFEGRAVNLDLDRFRPWLVLLARARLTGRLGGKLDASDAAQQALLEACRTLPHFRGSTEAELAAWLRSILANVLAHEIRRYAGTEGRDVSREVSLDAELAESSRRLRNVLADPGPSPSERAAGQEQEVRLADVLARLPDDYREVIVLRHLEGLTHEAVARRMGRGVGAVRMLWVRALARLRRELTAPPGVRRSHRRMARSSSASPSPKMT